MSLLFALLSLIKWQWPQCSNGSRRRDEGTGEKALVLIKDGHTFEAS